jgi:hypothetical protein
VDVTNATANRVDIKIASDAAAEFPAADTSAVQ